MTTIELPFHLLSETERLYLRMVHRGLTSKQIADERNVRVDAVDRVLRRARAKLNGLPRHEAARRLVEFEAAQNQGVVGDSSEPIPPPAPHQSLGAPGLALAEDQGIASPGRVERPNEGHWGPSAHGAASLLDRAIWAGLLPSLFGSERSLRNDLDTWSRIAAISVVAAGAAGIAGAALSFVIVLDRFAVGL